MSNQISSIINSFYQDKLHIIPKNITLLKSIILNLDNSNTSWIKYYKDLYIKNNTDFVYNNLLPIHIINDLKLKKHRTYSIAVNILKHSFNINIIVFKNNTLAKSKIITMIKHIYKILYLLLTLKTSVCSLTNNINIYLHDSKKVFPVNKRTNLSSYNVNTAFTWACNNKIRVNEMNIYRQEEWFKVFIHECFHMFGLDFSYTSKLDRYNKVLAELFNVNIDFKFFESYAETWAIILNSLYIAYDTSYKIKNIRNWNINIIKKFINILQQEQYFSLFQTCKVLKYSNISLLNIDNNMNYNESTPIFSYFLLKSILLFNINDFFEWCSNNNTKYIQFNTKNILSFYQLIPLFYNNKFHNTIISINNYLNKYNNYSNYNFNNLRLSINEIHI